MARKPRASAKDTATLVYALIHGLARWEWFEGREDCGELFVRGMRHTLSCDDRGVPALTRHAERAIELAMQAPPEKRNP